MVQENQDEEIRRKLALAAQGYLKSEKKDAVSFLIEVEKLTNEYYRVQHPELQD